jgi:hypothetical protein
MKCIATDRDVCLVESRVVGPLGLSSFSLMLEAAVLNGVAFSFHQDSLPAPEATRAYPL